MSRWVQALAAVVLLTVMPAVAAAADKLTFVTDFGFQGRHAYFYVALDKGYYRDAGIDLEIIRGNGSTDAIKQVATGTAGVGFADLGALILARGNDGLPVKAVAPVYYRPPHAIFALKESGIRTPKDLEGRRIADTATSAVRRMFPAYAKVAGIDESKINWVVVTPDAIAATLARGQADAVGFYSVGQALLEKAVAPKEVVRLDYADAGLDFYSNSLIASDSLLSSNPDLVKRFAAATLKGLADAVANPVEAGQILAKYQKQIDPAIGTAETKLVGSLLAPAGNDRKFDAKRVEATIALVKTYFDLGKDVTSADVTVDILD